MLYSCAQSRLHAQRVYSLRSVWTPYLLIWECFKSSWITKSISRGEYWYFLYLLCITKYEVTLKLIYYDCFCCSLCFMLIILKIFYKSEPVRVVIEYYFSVSELSNTSICFKTKWTYNASYWRSRLLQFTLQIRR